MARVPSGEPRRRRRSVSAASIAEITNLAGIPVSSGRAHELLPFLNRFLPGLKALRSVDVGDEPPAPNFRAAR